MQRFAAALCLLACLASPVSSFAPTSILPSAALRSRGVAAVARSGQVAHGVRRVAMEGGVGRSSIDVLDAVTSGIASMFRPTSAFVSGYRAQLDQSYKNTFDLPLREFSESLPTNRPQKTLELYEFEACPFCRKVREAITMLDIDVIVYPCPKDGVRYRGDVVSRGGKAQFPYLVDSNTGFEAYESDDIVRYLFQTYGDGIVPLELAAGPLTTASVALASALRRGKGGKAESNLPPPPPQPVTLWSFEGSPFCRVVRERMTELELPHKIITVARGSSKREALKEMAGIVQVPYLEDPNTGIRWLETADILSYLDRTYGPGAEPVGAATAEPWIDDMPTVSVQAELVDPLDANTPLNEEDISPSDY